MLLLAVNDDPYATQIDVNTINKVTTLCDWQLKVRELHDPIDADGTVAKMEEKIRRVLRNKGALKDRELKQHTNANRVGLWCFKVAIKNLKDAKEIVQNDKDKQWRIIE